MKRMMLWLLALVMGAGVVLTADPAAAQRGRWVNLGEQSVGFGVDRDVVRIGRDEGWMRAIRLSASNSDVQLLRLRLVYQNGFAEELRAESVLRAGGRPFEIDLRGERGFLKEIEMTYRSRPGYGGRALVKVEGRLVRGYDRPGVGGAGRGWVSLGRQTVGFVTDRDVVAVGRDEGWLRAIRLKAERNDVRLINVRIVYANGYAEDFRAATTLRAGGQPYVVDLRGERAFLKQIELTYRTRPNFQGQAVVEVEGQVARRRD